MMNLNFFNKTVRNLNMDRKKAYLGGNSLLRFSKKILVW